MKIYRWMKADADGKPRTGQRFGELGVRPKGGPGRSDVDAQAGTDVVSAALPKGMSASTDPGMPRSPGDEFVLWEIDTDAIGPALAAEHNRTPNNAGHYLVKPAKDMGLSDYQQALAATRDDWRPADVGDGS